MLKSNIIKIKFIGIVATILFVSVVLSVTVLVDRMQPWLPDDSGAIDLLANPPQSAAALMSSALAKSGINGANSPLNIAVPSYLVLPDAPMPEDSFAAPDVAENADHTDMSGSGSDDNPNESNPATPDKKPNGTESKPGFEASDDKKVWTTNTNVEIFRISYENGEHVVTVNSDNGEKVIAPGTSNSYTFKLKNTGNVPIDYKLSIDAYFTPSDIAIPIRARLSRYDGRWLVGDSDTYGNIKALDMSEDKATLSAGRYTYYTLEWEWPFESNDDTYDTMLGNMATNEDLLFTIVINTVAEEGDGGGGITPPQTGDNSYVIWGALIAGGVAIAVIALFPSRRKQFSEADE